MSIQWTLIPVSAVYGVIAVLIFRRFTERFRIRRSVNRVVAHVMELGLFLDSPGLIFGAQFDLLRENVRLLRLVIVPATILALLFALLFAPLNAIYGHAPLPAGEPSVVTIRVTDALMPPPVLEAPEGIVVETPGVRIVRDRQISWRVRPLRPGLGDLQFRIDARVVPRSSIEIRYPPWTLLGLSWLAWFTIISTASAFTFGLCWKR
jgi:hypothetical protein